ncbi:MAG: response regulator [Bdellovibrionales bacterium]|nr:response regulator [Bdellovibrionales bacterium]
MTKVTSNEKSKILVVDDEVDIQEIIKDLFEVFGFDVTTASSGNEAQAILENDSFDVIISDVRMPDGSGIDLLKWVRNRSLSEPKFFFITGYSDHTIPEVLDLGAEGLFAKPFEASEMRENIKKAFLTQKERWTNLNPPVADKALKKSYSNLEKVKENGEFNYGRGGFFIKEDPKNFAIGDLVDVELDFSDQGSFPHFKGLVEVIWVRPPGNSQDLSEGIGVEIRSVDRGVVKDYLQWVETHPVKSYIPIA